jgi:hypothetical protein
VELCKRDTRATFKYQELGAAEGTRSVKHLAETPFSGRKDLHRLAQNLFFLHFERTTGLKQAVCA